MNLPRQMSIAAMCLSACLAHAAGVAFIEVSAGPDGPALHGAVWTPCATSASTIAPGPMTRAGVKDCAVAGVSLPLVVVSHGTGGSALGHHDTTEALADAGFVVAAINHPGDNFQDLSRQQGLSAFGTRPVDLRRLVDFMLRNGAGQARIDAARVGVFGFSRGGYTSLVAVGAVPDFASRPDLCPTLDANPMCMALRRGERPPAPVPDARLKVAVVVDPLSLFDAAGLAGVTVPVQLWASEFGGDGVTPDSVAALRRALPAAPDWHVAIGAGHFAFLAPCSPAMAHALPEICRDPAGFDRVAFHRDFNARVVAFFRRHLMPD